MAATSVTWLTLSNSADSTRTPLNLSFLAIATVLRRVRPLERHLGFFVADGQKIIGAGETNPAGQLRRPQAFGAQPAIVQRHHGCVVRPGAVAHHVDP
jgi:hypothetical protein